MATIATSIDADIDLTVHVVQGNLTKEQLLSKLHDYYAGETTKRVLWDFTRGTVGAFRSSREVQTLVSIARQYSREGGRTALVMSSDLDFGMGRMLEAHAMMNSYSYVFGVFRSVDDAMNWLDEPE